MNSNSAIMSSKASNNQQQQQQQQQATTSSQASGESGQKRTRRRKPKQVTAAKPMDEESVQTAQQQTNTGQRKTGLLASYGQPIQRGNSAAFKPTHLSSTPSIERNDPLLNDAILVDGQNGAIECARIREFQLDFSQYIQVVRSSYNVMTRLDRGLQKYLSFSAYQYYCVILLWKRIMYVLTERGNGVNEYAALEHKVPTMSIPDEIGYYLDGIGNLKDYNGLNYYLALQDVLDETPHNGISGTFGIVNSDTHISYETLPSPFVAYYRMLYDLAVSTGLRRTPTLNVSADWDLPATLKDQEIQNDKPNRNLLCWDRARPLTSEQIQMFEYGGMIATFNAEGVPVFEVSQVDNYLGLPINREVLLQISELLSGSKSPHNTHAESTSYKGSLAQLGFIVRDDSTPNVSGYSLPPISQRNGTGMFFAQSSVHMCSGVSLFRYRVRRKMPQGNDSLCYLGPRGGAPRNWEINCDAVFDSVPEWNYENFRTTLTNGAKCADDFSERVRRIAPK